MKPNPLEPRFRTLIGYLTGKEAITVEDILKDVAEKNNISVELITSRTRKREVVEARHIYCYRAKTGFKFFSLNDIGQAIYRDHSTVIAGIHNVQNIPSLNKKYHELYG
jgi:chromosomal replication initiator protein